MTPIEQGLNLILRAASFAAAKHRDQRRKDPEASPYINHPIALAEVLSTLGGVSDPTVIAAALLHDTIEDTDTDAAELIGMFGADVAGIVCEVTDDKVLAKAERKRLQVEHAPRLTDGARLVKLADKICNLRDIVSGPPTDWTLARRREYFDWAKAVVDGIRQTNAGLELAFDEVYRLRP